MADTGKKVEVRYGAFACTIEGYDNPAEQLEAILGKMQKMIAETPQFSQVSSGSEAQDLQEALDPDKQEAAPSPGIVIIRDSDDSAAKSDGQTQPDESIPDAEEVSEPVSDEAVETEDSATFNEDATPPEAPSDAEAENDAAGEEALDDDKSDLTGFAASAAALATGAAAVSSFATDDETNDVNAGPTDVQGETEAEAASEHSVTTEADDPWTITETEAAEPTVEAEGDASAEREVEPDSDDAPVNIFADVEDTTETEATLTEADNDEGTDAEVSAADTSDAVNIFADPTDTVEAAELSEPESIPETQDAPEAAENIFAEPAAAASTEPGNIFAEPTEAAVAEPVNIFAEPRDTHEAVATNEPEELESAEADVNIFTSAEGEAEAPAPAAAEPNIFAEPEPQEEAEAEVNIFAEPDAKADVFAEREAIPEPEVNIFTNPEPSVSVAPAHPVVDTAVNIFAAPEEAITEAASSVSETVEDTVNIFAEPVSEVANDVREQTAQMAEDGASMWDQATETLELATPETVHETLDDLGARVSGLTVASDTTAEHTDTDPAFSIFPDAPGADTPSQPAMGTENAGQITNNRFQTLLGRGPGGPVMGAPGEPDSSAASKPETGTVLGAGIASAGDLAQRVGSDSVSDLLAASAAWLTLAEGKSRFSRREVMDIFETIPGDHPKTLEARIKGYGKLVRSGMLVLVDDGVFAMAQSERDRFQTTLDRS